MPSKSVYILEDEAVIALILNRYLKKHGYNVVGKSDNADQARPEIIELDPDILLVDIYLAQNTNGITLVKSLDTPRPATIFLTGNSDEATREQAMSLNPVGYMVKPIDMEKLLDLIEQKTKLKD